ncbi:hypothetical protein DFQ27_003502 [Actinomortierella ambigua]|uniref:Cytochrome P450 n=1 Tax=Actinomortierella ambigua TaxID=1343610 RepID=A0A9P6U4Q2_9FUNG|nr:hypothetical protein DFQ27_003502 [Actinomortierella ambigua]
MSLVALRRSVDLYLARQKRSPFEYIVLATIAFLLGAMIKYPDRAFGTRSRPDLKDKGSRGYPLIGNLPQIFANRHDPLGAILKNHVKYGNTTTATVPIIGRFIAVNTVEDMEYILKTNMENYIKGDLFRRTFSDLLGQGIFTSDGQQWRFHRKTASNIFTTRLYRDLVKGAFRSTAGELATVLEQKMKRGEYADLQKHFHALTLDAFGRLTFGLHFHAISTEGTHEFGDAFDYMTHVTESRSANPFWPWTDPFVPGKKRKIQEAIGILDKYATQAVEARRKETEEEKGTRPRDLLDHFINYENDDGSKLTDAELRDVFTNFMIAGRDTTAQGLTWVFYMLMSHPPVLAKLHEEIDAVFQGSDEYTYEQVAHDLPYAKAVFYETLRLYPPVTKNAKVAVEADILPCGVRVDAGDVISYSSYALARNQEVWGADAERFNPDRWLNEDPKAKSPFGKFRNESTFKFNSFNAGPRICLGQTFATLEALTTMAFLLQKFDFKLAPDHPIPVYKPSLTIPMQDPLLVEISKRQ